MFPEVVIFLFAFVLSEQVLTHTSEDTSGLYFK